MSLFNGIRTGSNATTLLYVFSLSMILKRKLYGRHNNCGSQWNLSLLVCCLFCVMLFCLCEWVFLFFFYFACWFACWLVGLFVCVSKNNFSFQNNDRYLFWYTCVEYVVTSVSVDFISGVAFFLFVCLFVFVFGFFVVVGFLFVLFVLFCFVFVFFFATGSEIPRIRTSVQ